MGKAKGSKTLKVEVNFWGMLQNVINHSITKGQFPALAVVGLVSILLIRMPAEQLPGLWNQIIETFKSAAGISYTLNISMAIAWFAHSRHQRRSISEEMDRIGREKTRLQEESTQRKLASSAKSKG